MRRAPALLLGLTVAATAHADRPAAPELPGSPTVPGLDADVLARARAAHACATARGDLARAAHPDHLAIIDFARPSTETRLWVIDVSQDRLILSSRVAHGQGTGELLAQAFSNDPGSHQSSLGVFRTAETYTGGHGRSLRLDGLEPGVNDRARERAIVVHAADYATDDFVQAHGRLGRSWGCPAVAPEVIDPLLDVLADGALLVAHYPDTRWLTSSPYLSCDAR